MLKSFPADGRFKKAVNVPELTSLWRESTGHCAVVLAELSQQAGRNSEQITACQSLHFPCVPEGGAHHHCAVVKLFIVVVDLSHTQHT